MSLQGALERLDEAVIHQAKTTTRQFIAYYDTADLGPQACLVGAENHQNAIVRVIDNVGGRQGCVMDGQVVLIDVTHLVDQDRRELGLRDLDDVQIHRL